MAVTKTGYPLSFVSNDPEVWGSIGVYEASDTSDGTLLGTKRVVGDRLFRYAKNGTVALAAGKLCQSMDTTLAAISEHTNMAVVSGAAGAYTMVVTVGAGDLVAVNYYADGYVFINAGTGLGQTMRIKSHPAAAVDAALTLTLYDPIVTALAASSKASLQKHELDGVVIYPTTITGIPVGWPLVPVAASYYFWILRVGPVAALAEATDAIAVGIQVAPDATTAGSVGIFTTGRPIVGRAMLAGVTNEYRQIMAKIE